MRAGHGGLRGRRRFSTLWGKNWVTPAKMVNKMVTKTAVTIGSNTAGAGSFFNVTLNHPQAPFINNTGTHPLAYGLDEMVALGYTRATVLQAQVMLKINPAEHNNDFYVLYKVSLSNTVPVLGVLDFMNDKTWSKQLFRANAPSAGGTRMVCVKTRIVNPYVYRDQSNATDTGTKYACDITQASPYTTPTDRVYVWIGMIPIDTARETGLGTAEVTLKQKVMWYQIETPTVTMEAS